MNLRRFLIVTVLAAVACKQPFNAGAFGSTEALYAAALNEYNAKRWDNATRAFERLTTELSPRDPRIALAYYYLGKSQEKKGDHLLAAKSYSRVYELLPQDTLADDALLASGRAYQHMWRKPVLDAEYGNDAITQFQTLQSLYPESPLLPQADAELKKLDEWFAIKDYSTGYHYLKRKAYDSAIIYFKDVIANFPNTRRAPDALLRLVDSYRAIRYTEELQETCAHLRRFYPRASGLDKSCPAAADSTATPSS